MTETKKKNIGLLTAFTVLSGYFLAINFTMYGAIAWGIVVIISLLRMVLFAKDNVIYIEAQQSLGYYVSCGLFLLQIIQMFANTPDFFNSIKVSNNINDETSIAIVLTVMCVAVFGSLILFKSFNHKACFVIYFGNCVAFMVMTQQLFGFQFSAKYVSLFLVLTAILSSVDLLENEKSSGTLGWFIGSILLFSFQILFIPKNIKHIIITACKSTEFTQWTIFSSILVIIVGILLVALMLLLEIKENNKTNLYDSYCIIETVTVIMGIPFALKNNSTYTIGFAIFLSFMLLLFAFVKRKKIAWFGTTNRASYQIKGFLISDLTPYYITSLAVLLSSYILYSAFMKGFLDTAIIAIASLFIIAVIAAKSYACKNLATKNLYVIVLLAAALALDLAAHNVGLVSRFLMIFLITGIILFVLRIIDFSEENNKKKSLCYVCLTTLMSVILLLVSGVKGNTKIFLYSEDSSPKIYVDIAENDRIESAEYFWSFKLSEKKKAKINDTLIDGINSGKGLLTVHIKTANGKNLFKIFVTE